MAHRDIIWADLFSLSQELIKAHPPYEKLERSFPSNPNENQLANCLALNIWDGLGPDSVHDSISSDYIQFPSFGTDFKTGAATYIHEILAWDIIYDIRDEIDSAVARLIKRLNPKATFCGMDARYQEKFNPEVAALIMSCYDERYVPYVRAGVFDTDVIEKAIGAGVDAELAGAL